MPSNQFARIPVRWRKAILAFAVVGVSVGIMLMADREPSPAENGPSVETSITSVQAAEPVVAKPAAKPRAPRTAAKPVAASAARTGSAPEPATSPVVDSPAPAPRTEAAPTAAASAQGEPATIVGCLEFDDDAYRLTDTEGGDAPKSRSWRSGFIRRSNARLDVTDSANRLRLATHVGHRVSLTGTLVEREMQARSLKMVANTCDD